MAEYIERTEELMLAQVADVAWTEVLADGR